MKDELSERRFLVLVERLRRLTRGAQDSPRRNRITLEIIVEDRRVSPLSEIVIRQQPLRDRALTSDEVQEQT
jgi:hypothetical protein